MTGTKHRSESHPGNKFGPYLTVAEMGRGGTGIVRKCRHETSGALVAVKISRDTSRLQRDFIRKEINMLARLGRAGIPGVVRVLEHGASRGALWYAMDFVEGIEFGRVVRALWGITVPEPVTRTESGPGLPQTLTALVEKSRHLSSGEPTVLAPGALPRPAGNFDADPVPGWRPPAASGLLELILEFGVRLARTLAFIHAEGILHGDLKPRNILLRMDGQPVLVDFGTALYTSDGRILRELAQIEGIIHGTPGYMAPEQIRGEPLDARCDLYALGVILYELVAGRQPFVSDQISALNRQHLQMTPAPPSTWVDQVPPGLDLLILQLLEKDPRRRTGHALDVHEALTALLPPETRAAAERTLLPVRTLYRPRLAGRQAALEQVEAELDRSRRGEGRGHLLLLGESGAGKTRLLNEIGSRAVAGRFEVVAGGCLEPPASTEGPGLRGPALQPLRPTLQRIVDRHQLERLPALPTEALEAAAVLALFEPALASLGGESAATPALPVLPPELARGRVLRSLAVLLRSFAEAAGLVVLLDDLQWADELTLAFLASDQIESLARSRVLIVATCREEQLPAALKARIDAGDAPVVSLDKLSADQLRTLVADMLASPLAPEGVAEFLHRQSEGNPLFATEWLRACVEAGLLARDAQGNWSASRLTLGARHELPLPDSLQGLLDLRRGTLSRAQAELLDIASVLGRTFTAELLISCHPGSGDQASRRLDELVALRFLEEVNPGEYRFVHDRIRQTRQSAMDRGRRRELHQRIATTLETGTGGEHLADPAMLGYHWAHAGAPEKAVPHLLSAARTAEQTFANEQSIELYRRGLAGIDELLARDPAASSRRISPVAEALADLLALSGRHEEARHDYDRAWAALTTDGDQASARARLGRKKAKSFWTLHDYANAEAAFLEAERALGPVETHTPEARREWLEIQQGRFWLLYFARQLGEKSAALLDAMADTVERFGTPNQRAMYYQCQAADILGPSRYRFSAVAVRLNRLALQVYEGQEESFVATIEARFDLAFALVHGSAAQCGEAVTLFERVRDEALRAGDSTFLARASIYLATGLRRLGRVADTETVASEALAAAQRARITPYIGAARGHLAWVAWRSGNPERAIGLADEALDWWKRGTHVYVFRWSAVLVLLVVHSEREDLRAVREDLEDLLQPSQQVFPDELQESLTEARSALLAPDPPPAAAQLVSRALTLAARLGYL